MSSKITSNTQVAGVSRRGILAGGLGASLAMTWTNAIAASSAETTAKAQKALAALYLARPKSKALAQRAKAILVFPDVVKAGAMVGGQTGVGVMLVDDKAVGFYRLASGSFGLQLGAQRYGYALFFMTDAAIDYLKTSDGWSVGTGPSVVMVDQAFAKSLTTTTLTQDVYAVTFDQKGLMAGAGLEGSKISPTTLD